MHNDAECKRGTPEMYATCATVPTALLVPQDSPIFLPLLWLASVILFFSIYLFGCAGSCSRKDLRVSLWHVGSFHCNMQTLSWDMSNLVP